jgi:hypothetical protein
MKKIISVIMAAALFAALAGCGKTVEKPVNSQNITEIVDFSKYKDSDDVPDWTGKKLNLTMWVNASDPNSSLKGKVASNDVLTPEFERITGVSVDPDNSFDNAGSSYDAQIAKIIASNEYPDGVRSLLEISNLVDKKVLWRLDELIEKYAPNVYRLFGPGSKVFGDEWNRQVKEYGGLYALSISTTPGTIKPMVEKDAAYGLTEEQVNAVSGEPQSPYGFVWVRDDVLKKIYPDAKSCKELEEIFNQNGKFTEDEIFDVPLNSSQDFIDMLYKINDLHLTENGKPLYTTFTHNGNDNWPVITGLGGIFGHNTTPGLSDVTYFTYWDRESKSVKETIKQDWFKNILRKYNQLVRDDVASKEALVDTNNLFNEKLNSGRYIVSYGWLTPGEEIMKGRPYGYRKVYVKQKINTDKFAYFGEEPTTYNKLSFFNKRLTEEDMIQVVRMLDFVCSGPGQKLTYWGPKKAGLFTETEDGKLKFTDPAVEAEVIADLRADAQLKYNLQGMAWPGFFGVSASNYTPKLFYAENKTWRQAFSAGYIEQFEATPGKSPLIYQPEVLGALPDAKKFWQAREGFENAMVKVFAAANDAEFETQYRALLDYAERNKLNDETIAAFDKFYKEQYNSAYMKYLE